MIGNDLSTPMPLYRFPVWFRGPVVCDRAQLAAGLSGQLRGPGRAGRDHERTLEVVALTVLQEHAVDVPTT